MDEFAGDAFFAAIKFFWPRDRPGLILLVADQDKADCCYAFVLRDIVHPELLPVCRDQLDRGLRFEEISVEDACRVSPQEFLDLLHTSHPPGGFDPTNDDIPEKGVTNNFKNAFSYMKERGVYTEAQYPYEGKVQVYREPTLDPDSKIFVEGYKRVPREFPGVVVQWLTKQPLTGALLLVKSLTSWTSQEGIYQGATKNELELLEKKKQEVLTVNPLYHWSDPYHAVTIVGYGVEEGTPYYVCKNSWGPKWGHKGYIKVVRDKVTNIRRAIRPFRKRIDD